MWSHSSRLCFILQLSFFRWTSCAFNISIALFLGKCTELFRFLHGCISISRHRQCHPLSFVLFHFFPLQLYIIQKQTPPPYSSIPKHSTHPHKLPKIFSFVGFPATPTQISAKTARYWLAWKTTLSTPCLTARAYSWLMMVDCIQVSPCVLALFPPRMEILSEDI